MPPSWYGRVCPRGARGEFAELQALKLHNCRHSLLSKEGES